MLPILQIGPFALQTPGMILLLGVWVGLSLAERSAARFGVRTNDLYNLALVGLAAGIIGARLTIVGRHPAAFMASPASILSLNPGLLDPLGGMAVGAIAAIVYGQRKELAFWPTLDALTPAFAAFALALGLSNLASGQGYGAPTDLPWGIELWGMRRHPSQLYESLAAALILALVWFRQAKARDREAGHTFLTFVALSSAARLFLEAFRGDGATLPNGMRTVQVIAWLVLALSLVGLKRR